MATSNIEAAARGIAAEICARHPQPGEDVGAWIDRHWEAVAAELEAGLIEAVAGLHGRERARRRLRVVPAPVQLGR